jgi:hypothetical protein
VKDINKLLNILLNIAVAKMLRQQTFFNSLSHTPQVHVQHTKLIQSKQEAAVCVCAISAF